MADKPLSIGFNVPFSEAIAAAVARKVVLPDKYYGELQGIARQQAFTISGITSLDQLQQVKDSLDQALKSGQSFHDWKKTVTESGILNLPKHRLDNIFRTNLQGAYMAGKWEKILNNVDRRPYVMYDAINDSRVRPSHLALDGIIRRWDDPFWQTHSPPNGYRCRCSIISLTEAQAQARSTGDKGLNKQPVYTDAKDIVRQAEPDKGWDYNPSDRLAGVKQAMANKEGKVSRVLLSSLSDKLKQTMQIVPLEGFDVVQGKVAQIAQGNPEWFPLGFNGIHAVSNPELFAAFNPKEALFYLSVADEMIPGFSPAKELISAVDKISLAQPLTFNNEYAIETLWHEMIHGITGILKTKYPLNIEPISEGIVQIIARHSYNPLLIAMGSSHIHQEKIITSGLAYPNVTANLLYLLNSANIEVESIIDVVKEGNIDPLKALIADKLSLSVNKFGYLLNLAEGKSLSAFKAKVDVQIKNAQRNKGAS